MLWQQVATELGRKGFRTSFVESGNLYFSNFPDDPNVQLDLGTSRQKLVCSAHETLQ